MGAGCNAPLAGFATLERDTLTLSALVGAPDGRHVKVTRSAPLAQAAALGADVASALVADGGAQLLAAAIGDGHTNA
jgi:hydroxymethylbilane synthase